MEDWMRDECIRRGYELVYTPHIMRRELWKIIRPRGLLRARTCITPMELDDAEYRLKPMNCPGHILIYKNSPQQLSRSAACATRELGNVYRYERSGTMHGLLRVRGFTQDDAHIFCTPEQIEDEVVGCIEFARDVLKTFGFDEFKVELSTWDPNDREKYDGSRRAMGAGRRLARAARSSARTSRSRRSPARRRSTARRSTSSWSTRIGRLWQLSTVQFDFNLPRALRAGIRRRRRRAASAGDGASRAVRLGRALLRRADRALRRRVSAVARAGAGRRWCRSARSTSSTRTKVKATAEGRRPARGARCAQRKDEREDPRLRACRRFRSCW